MTVTYIFKFVFLVSSLVSSLNIRPSRTFSRITQRHSFLTSLGTPSDKPSSGQYTTKGGVSVTFNVKDLTDSNAEIENIVNNLDDTKGLLLTSSYEYPGRYARWTVGFLSPPIHIEGKGMSFSITPLNSRGKILVQIIRDHLTTSPTLFALQPVTADNIIYGSVIPSSTYFSEENRSQQPSLFSLVRQLNELFFSENSGQLGLYGAFGYDLTFQFEPIKMHKERSDTQRDISLYLPDEIVVVDNYKSDSWKISYDFEKSSVTTQNLPREVCKSPFSVTATTFESRDTPQGQYAEIVDKAKEQFKVGNLFEVVLSQVFRHKLDNDNKPSAIFKRLCKRNPSPYGFFINLGRNEYLVGASPEMFVRVENNAKGRRVETCPISGTIERGRDPLEDAQQIKKLLLNAKEESELTMCTDVDRNDKSRICEPGTIKVLGRRQIEMYSKLIHTVDHVEGYLRKEYDALDALLCHTWAVTVTGAPKTWAIRFIEQTETSVRHWYGGAVGLVGFDGSLNTGLTLRTIRINEGIAEVRAGATLLYDSDPVSEEKETELKASAMIESILNKDMKKDGTKTVYTEGSSESRPFVLLVDHEDSFVHTLADYLRQTGSEVMTCRCGNAFHDFVEKNIITKARVPDLVVLSPGPGNPSDFQLSKTIETLISHKIPMFGVCLGLQGLVEYFGGKLSVLPTPVHGKATVIHRTCDDTEQNDILRGISPNFQVGRYHSLHGDPETLKHLKITALSPDGVVMSVCHETMPIAAVQFHPESILTSPTIGMKILTNALSQLKSSAYPQ